MRSLLYSSRTKREGLGMLPWWEAPVLNLTGPLEITRKRSLSKIHCTTFHELCNPQLQHTSTTEP